ncbi:hypothetical protein MNEG_0657 [Monoraphidium neglectum]|uniref:Uncharacterized protein n=1 Tax=Monoraphidium neglectum TaxID=145388 RepID=A0A0D2KAN8_9CHLO|nr:hypothetical protein MNEG_0657 [Monoraphidium neglectum]KIZ07313.1 hypothetical protein MNEG_0657 [Monoraphidium neglectum]|eukprot:XP_013906332.1 hypothetical protein MNEG_0657 [Monoraphidium neglectum]
MSWGSLSSNRQLLALDVVLADGSLRRFTPEKDPFLFRALRLSVGKLGVITRAKLRIVREVPVRRELVRLAPPAFLAEMTELQEAARALQEQRPGAALPSWANETEWFWIPQKYEFMRVSFQRADECNSTLAAAAKAGFVPDNTTVFASKGELLAMGEIQLPADAVLNLTSAQLTSTQPLPKEGLPERASQVIKDVIAVINEPVPREDNADPAAGQTWPEPTHNRPSAFYAAVNMAEGTNEASRIGILQVAGNATLESTAAYIKQPNTTLAQLRRILYDQYEVGGACARMKGRVLQHRLAVV